MKCPNCSFNNASNADICKVCGYALAVKEAKKDEAPIPVPQPNKPETPNQESHTNNLLNDLFGETDSEVYEINLSERSMESHKKQTKPIRFLALVTAILILLLFGFVLFWPKLSELKWFKGIENEDTLKGTVEKDKKETEEAPLPLAPQEQFINDFFDAFVKDINAKTLKADTLNLTNEQVEAYHSLGPVLTFTKEKPTLILSSGNQKTYEIASKFYHEMNGVTKETPVVFKISFTEAQSIFTLESLHSDFANKEVAELELEPEVDKEPTKEEKEEEKTPDEPEEIPKSIPNGFSSSGSFKGGIDQKDLTLSALRYGNNVTFERVVLDFTDSSSSPISASSLYSASVSNNGQTLTLTVSGVKNLSASTTPLKGVKTIKETVLSHNSNANKVTFKITLSRKGAFKVFNMTEPGKIVIDFIEL